MTDGSSQRRIQEDWKSKAEFVPGAFESFESSRPFSLPRAEEVGRQCLGSVSFGFTHLLEASWSCWTKRFAPPCGMRSARVTCYKLLEQPISSRRVNGKVGWPKASLAPLSSRAGNHRGRHCRDTYGGYEQTLLTGSEVRAAS